MYTITMDQQPTPQPYQPAPVMPAPAPMMPQMPAAPVPTPPAAKKSSGILLTSLVVVVLIAAYAAYAFFTGMWPFGPGAALYPSPSPTASATALPSVAPTVGWKTYSNAQYGFEVQDPYPVGSAGVVSGKFEVQFATPPGETRAVITVEPSTQTAQQWFDSLPKTPDYTLVVQHLTISGEPAVQVSGDGFGLSQVGVQHGGYFYLFDGNMLDPLLSTFRFTK